MDWLAEKINYVLQWFISLIVNLLYALFDFCTDLLITILKLILTAIVKLIGLIPVPEFITAGISGYISMMPDSVLFLMSTCGFNQAFLVLGAGLSFRLIRKFLTLFQW